MSVPNGVTTGREERSRADGACSALLWPTAPQKARLDRGQVHLWAAVVDEFIDQTSEFRVLLSSTEKTTAEKFKFVTDGDRYVIRHGLLRLILSGYIGQSPKAIMFRAATRGKPELLMGSSSNHIFFNTSHSGDIAVIAVTPSCPIGVDIERVSEIPEIEGIANQFFIPNETRTLMTLPVDSRTLAFYACWTRKEAFLKATGEGIAESLAKVEVSLAPEEEPRVVALSGRLASNEPWHLQSFSPSPGYLGCLAYKNTPLALSQWSVSKSTVWNYRSE